LKKLNQGEFEAKSKFDEPSYQLILQQITCTHCQSNTNLEICKDYDSFKNGWICEECESLFCNKEIEKRLIQILNSRTIAYQIQDYEESKIPNAPKPSPSKHQIKNLLSPQSDIKQMLILFKNIARLQNMNMLFHISDAKLKVC
jgi:hypothetical protein